MANVLIEEVEVILTKKEIKDLKEKISTEFIVFLNKILSPDGLKIDPEYTRCLDDLFDLIYDEESSLDRLTKETEKEEESITVNVIRLKNK